MTIAASTSALGAVAVLTAAITVPLESGDESREAPMLQPAAVERAGHLPTDMAADDSQTFLVDLQRLSAVPLRKPLVEASTAAPSSTAVSTTPAATALSAKLVGAFHEPGHSIAMFTMADGSVAMRFEGESLDDPSGRVEITHVGERKVTIRRAGQIAELAIPPRPGESP